LIEPYKRILSWCGSAPASTTSNLRSNKQSIQLVYELNFEGDRLVYATVYLRVWVATKLWSRGALPEKNCCGLFIPEVLGAKIGLS